jgi:dolichyl-phosphate beta-glucosyltransferase
VGRPDIAIVVPCYNEAARLSLEQFRGFADSFARVRFVFVNDGSRDDTSAVLQRLTTSDPSRFELLDQPVNRGKAEAVRIGMLHALQSGAAYAGYWDADLATPLREIPRFLAALETHRGFDICFGSRVRLLGRAIERRALRHYLGRLFATFASLSLDLPVYDTQCGAKLFRSTEHTALLFAEPFCVNWTFDVEIIARVQSLRGETTVSIYELPLDEWRDVAGSKVKPSDFARGLLEMLRILAKYGRGGAKRPLRLSVNPPAPKLASGKRAAP